MTIFLFILILVVLILVHEFGHFIVAKAFKIRVDEFGIFFPPRIAAWKLGETEYSINWLPFGGFVRIFGENLGEGANDPRSLARKPRVVQAAVIVAGVVCNVLFAWLVLSGGYMAGMPTTLDRDVFGGVQDAHATIVETIPASPADLAGLKPEDSIVQVETGTTKLRDRASAQEITDFIAAHQEESVVLTVLRPSTSFGESETEMTFLAKPAAGFAPDRKVIGLRMADLGILQLPPHLALLQGGFMTYEMVLDTAQGLAGFFTRLVRGAADFNTVAGPIGIVAMGSSFIDDGYVAIVFLVASISITLALFNVVPIPGLDGGRLLFIVIEGIIRRPISPRLSFAFTATGFGLLILLMLVVSYHDIAKLVG
ncbi:MAG: site-2 protease family protein [Patescibacteria group bacterium]